MAYIFVARSPASVNLVIAWLGVASFGFAAASLFRLIVRERRARLDGLPGADEVEGTHEFERYMRFELRSLGDHLRFDTVMLPIVFLVFYGIVAIAHSNWPLAAVLFTLSMPFAYLTVRIGFLPRSGGNRRSQPKASDDSVS